jgi:hypothetical protein
MIISASTEEQAVSVTLSDDSDMARVVWAFRTVALGLGYAPDTVYEYIPAPNE